MVVLVLFDGRCKYYLVGLILIVKAFNNILATRVVLTNEAGDFIGIASNLVVYISFFEVLDELANIVTRK